MAVFPRMAPRKHLLQSALIVAAIFAAAVALIPIVCGVFGVFGAGAGAKTAFASAPPGQYAVVSRTDGATDEIAITSPGATTPPQVVARVSHLNGFGAKGAVSPDGKYVAVVAATGGQPANPVGSLLLVDLTSGKSSTLLTGIDAQQTPVWTANSKAIVVSRDEGSGPITVEFLSVPIGGGAPSTIDSVESVLGAYAVGFDAQGRFVDVSIDGSGSTVRRAGAPLQLISTQVTRDWRLSPDGTQLAFIESSLVGGLHYSGNTLALDGASSPAVESQTASDGQQLGVAWQPGAGQATFGDEPGTAATAAGSAEAQTAGGGFNVPLAYSHNGAALAAEHWSGPNFEQAGESSLVLIQDGQSTPIPGFGRFLGWTAR